MTPDRTIADRQRLTGAAKLLIAFCVAIVLLTLAIGGWRLFATVNAFPPTMESTVVKDGDGWTVTIGFRNRAGQEAPNFVMSAAQIGASLPKEKLPISFGTLAPLERKTVTLHFKEPIKPSNGKTDLLVSYNCGSGRNLIGVTTAKPVEVK